MTGGEPCCCFLAQHVNATEACLLICVRKCQGFPLPKVRNVAVICRIKSKQQVFWWQLLQPQCSYSKKHIREKTFYVSTKICEGGLYGLVYTDSGKGKRGRDKQVQSQQENHKWDSVPGRWENMWLWTAAVSLGTNVCGSQRCVQLVWSRDASWDIQVHVPVSICALQVFEFLPFSANRSLILGPTKGVQSGQQ